VPAGHQAAPPPVYRGGPSSASSAAFTVRSPFLLKIITVGGSSWVQASVTGPHSQTFAATMAAGQTKDFLVPTGDTLTVHLGSAAGRAFVYVGPKLVGFYFPPAAPYTLVYQSVPAS
jgi:hypothetical protein